MHEKIICAGFGGQGIMLMGKLLAEAGMREGYTVTWLPSYGAEVRGGTAHSMVHISCGKIAAPTILKPTTCIVMNKPSLIKFMERIEKGGLLIVNTSMVDQIIEKRSVRIVAIPLTELASELGNVKVANMIAVGAFIKLKKLFPLKNVLDELPKMLPSKKDLIAINKKAIKLGYDSV
ncbi:MAG: 2-oxoacid:acceptor oxidoreductase family protein [Candidatus Omnitrophica bacterium]|nr:2-oxoacid:acceptor oxidoreductase family protein [Candidatus Omnitrophota bacterium]